MKSEPISSPANPAIKRIRSLRQRKQREKTGLFFAEGIRIVTEAVQVRAPVEALVIAPDLLESRFARSLCEDQRRMGVPVLEVTKEVFQSISDKDGPQGLAAVIRQRWDTPDAAARSNRRRWVALSGVQDPGNLGTVLRTSDAVGFAGVILVGPTTDPYDPACVRASMGAIFSQRLVRLTVEELAAWKNRYGYTFVGTSGAAPTNYRNVSYREPVVIFMGSEREGLSAQEQALCDVMVSIPMVGRSDSLNLAVATGVVLYEAFWQLQNLGVGRERT